MVKSAAERQAEFRAKSKDKFKRLDTLLPVEVFNLLHGNTKEQGFTKAAYIAELLHGNALKNCVTTNQDGVNYPAANEKLRIANDALRAKNIKQGNEIRELKSQVRELERVAALDGAIIDDFIAKRDGKQSNDSKAYDGNHKGFRAVVERLTGISQANRSKFANKLKSTYVALGITPKKNGRLSSDTDRLKVYEWLRDKPN